MADQNAKAVPGIPLAALEAIEDQNVRDVLRALVDAHHVRNGNSGSGDERFVTAKEVGLVNGRSSIAGGNKAIQTTTPASSITPAQVGRIINDLQSEILESQLFKDLGARIDLIDAPDGLIKKFNDLQDGVTDITTKTENSITQINGIKQTIYDTTTGLAAAQALIGEINNVTATSTSAAAQKLSAVRAVVYDPLTGLAKAQSNILDEKTARANNDNALARAVNTVWAAIGDNSALIQEGSEAVVNNAGATAQRWNQTQVAIKDPVTGNYINSAAIREDAKVAFNKADALEGKYTVKIDLNGYVSGFGLASTSNNSGNISEFYIRADRFAIASATTPRAINPDGSFAPSDPANIPFIVTTQPRYVNGVYAPAGVYIKDAFIENGTITRARIGLAEIDTLRVAGNAIVVPGSAVAGNTVPVTGAWTTVLTAYSDYGDAAPALVVCTASVNFLAQTSGSASSILVRICQDGVAGQMTCGISLPGGFSGVATITDTFAGATGQHSYQVQVWQSQGSTVYLAGARNITYMGAKR